MLNAVAWSSTSPSGFPGKLRIIDQTRLPGVLRHVELDERDAIRDAIRALKVRGAPALGCAAALGLAAICQHSRAATPAAFLTEAEGHAAILCATRPTAVNLAWALGRCLERLRGAADGTDLKGSLLDEARRILAEDKRLCQAIGEHGLELFGKRLELGILTHCNAGALATGGMGTALAPIYLAHQNGLRPHVFADETRPLLQGARLTCWELRRAGVPVTLICDNMAAQVMREGRVDLVLTGADRIAANGDTANKIGTYGLAVVCRHHRVPFYIAAPTSTIDHSLASGEQIPIEQRDADEVRNSFGTRVAPADCPVYNPAFDVTPANLITGIITERGILCPPFPVAIAALRPANRG